MNTAPSPNPTLSPTLSHAPTTYTPTTAQPSATPSHVPTTTSPRLAHKILWRRRVLGGPERQRVRLRQAHGPDPSPGSGGLFNIFAMGVVAYRDFELIHELDYFGGHVNAVGMYEGPFDGTQYALGASRRIRITTMRFRTCAAFDNKRKVCFEDQPLHLLKPNAGAVLGLDYYYGPEPRQGCHIEGSVLGREHPQSLYYIPRSCSIGDLGRSLWRRRLRLHFYNRGRPRRF